MTVDGDVANEPDEHFFINLLGVRGNLADIGDGQADITVLNDDNTSAPSAQVLAPNGGEVLIFLSWDDPMGRSANVYDLFLVDKTTGQVVAASNDPQRGAQDPQEFIDFVNTGASGTFEILVQNYHNAAQPRHLNLYSFEPECAFAGPLMLAAGRH